MSDIVIGIADLRVSKNVNDALVTYALGSCVGVAVYDPVVKVGGLLHYMLPESAIDRNKAQGNPEMFADTAVPLLFTSCYALGAQKRRMVVKVAGGANLIDDVHCFRIGQKNLTALRRIFWRNRVMIDAADTGRSCNRTMRLNLDTGAVFVRIAGGTMEELK
ncbi:MAG: chemotaxis protein CheD [Deltaproteobacteria bacterium]|nr:chemotaxis protein CheD [Deltaproteobacteria bacterium]